MIFNSLTFLLFFTVVIAVYYLPLPWRVRKFHLLLCGFFFYASWHPPYVVLLLLATGLDWALALYLDREVRPGRRKAILALSLAVNLGVLATFKYSDFLLSNFALLLRFAGLSWEPPSFGFFLPIGISFYTFENISYIVEVYKRSYPPTKSLSDYALFVSFFPHLVAGPIVRPRDFLPQVYQAKRADPNQICLGLILLSIGLFEKVILSDGILAGPADLVFAHASQLGFFSAWVGTLAFTGQIFFDFSGYSLCAIGTALSFGFVLKPNFHCPYASLGFSDFWKRWHISLSSWLRDYLYIPLGGSRGSEVKRARNLLLTMLLGGLWHGAAWHFVAWGFFHGTFLVLEHAVKSRAPSFAAFAVEGPWVRLFSMMLTFLAVCVGWVFFRAADLTIALQILAALAGISETTQNFALPLWWPSSVLLVMSATLFIQYYMRDATLEERIRQSPNWLRVLVLAALWLCLAFYGGNESAFIYFQF